VPAPLPTPGVLPALVGGDARAALLAALAAGRSKKMRMHVTITSVGTPGGTPRTFSMDVETAPPDRQRMQMHATPTITTEMMRIGTRAWMRAHGSPRWTEAPAVSVAVGTAGASNVIEESLHAIESGQVAVTREGEEAGMTAYRLTGTIPDHASVDTRLFVGADGLPRRYAGRTTRDTGATSDVEGTIDYDDTISIEPPTPCRRRGARATAAQPLGWISAARPANGDPSWRGRLGLPASARSDGLRTRTGPEMRRETGRLGHPDGSGGGNGRCKGARHIRDKSHALPEKGC